MLDGRFIIHNVGRVEVSPAVEAVNPVDGQTRWVLNLTIWRSKADRVEITLFSKGSSNPFKHLEGEEL